MTVTVKLKNPWVVWELTSIYTEDLHQATTSEFLINLSNLLSLNVLVTLEFYVLQCCQSIIEVFQLVLFSPPCGKNKFLKAVIPPPIHRRQDSVLLKPNTEDRIYDH